MISHDRQNENRWIVTIRLRRSDDGHSLQGGGEVRNGPLAAGLRGPVISPGHLLLALIRSNQATGEIERIEWA